MKDPRVQELANKLINYSVGLKKGESIYIENNGSYAQELMLALVEETYKVGGYPYVSCKDGLLERRLRLGATEAHFMKMAGYEANIMKDMDCYIGIRAGNNINENSDIPHEKNNIYGKTIWDLVHRKHRMNTRWVVLRYPTSSMAQLAQMSTESFEQFYFDVCNLDYSKMNVAMDALVNIMDKTDKVRIIGSGTDLTFSIKGIPAIKCAGHMNIPDGEIYTSPVRNSINGVISYNCPSPYQGYTFENVILTFEKGKIVNAEANDKQRIEKILNSDEGARYVGEFAIGVNPFIKNPMADILFDEKIDGSFHFTPGEAYENADNGNRSSVHWDLVSIQRPDWGGGEIWFDDVMVRKNGRFVIPELEQLNPENLQ